MEDGIVSRAYTDIKQGAGLRTVLGDQTGYAFTEDLSPQAMKAAQIASIPPSGPRKSHVAMPPSTPTLIARAEFVDI